MQDYSLNEQEKRLLQQISHIGIKGYGTITAESIPSYEEPNIADVSFFRIEKLSFDEKYPHREAFENVLASLSSIEFNFVYVLQSENNGQVGIYIGVVKNTEQIEISASDMGEIVQNAFRGNFSGSTLTRVINIDNGNRDKLSNNTSELLPVCLQSANTRVKTTSDNVHKCSVLFCPFPSLQERRNIYVLLTT
ncbi:MAG: hypothetical protein E7662_11885 [Ruminococcaceae bacterium]|nr:hypothetical protein [Oscillospiraceae bacterium]